MLYGYKGKLLHIDLSKESSTTIELPEEVLKKYIGGRGLGAKLYWDMVLPGTDALGPENMLMVLSGPVSGTAVPGSGKHLIVTKSPVTGGWWSLVRSKVGSSGLCLSELTLNLR